MFYLFTSVLIMFSRKDTMCVSFVQNVLADAKNCQNHKKVCDKNPKKEAKKFVCPCGRRFSNRFNFSAHKCSNGTWLRKEKYNCKFLIIIEYM